MSSDEALEVEALATEGKAALLVARGDDKLLADLFEGDGEVFSELAEGEEETLGDLVKIVVEL